MASLDAAPIGVLIRIGLGYLVVPAWSSIIGAGRTAAGWSIIPFLFLVLAMVRLVPGLVRRLPLFSDAVRAIWAERRQLARKADSYQWQKLLWIGLGLLAYSLLSHRSFPALTALTCGCLVSGVLGLGFWRQRSLRLKVAGASKGRV
jgi:hypothetical protein